MYAATITNNVVGKPLDHPKNLGLKAYNTIT